MKIFILLTVLFFSQSASAVWHEAACDQKPKACHNLSGVQPPEEWILGQIRGKPNVCAWTCDTHENGSDPAIKPLKEEENHGKSGSLIFHDLGKNPICVTMSKAKEAHCLVYTDGSKDKQCKNGHWARACVGDLKKLPPAQAVETPRPADEPK
jgi:hypothetical protein